MCLNAKTKSCKAYTACKANTVPPYFHEERKVGDHESKMADTLLRDTCDVIGREGRKEDLRVEDDGAEQHRDQ